MIGHLRGTLLFKKPPQLMIDVAGVGYEVMAPMTTFYDLPECGEPVELSTHFVVREDGQTLYGFAKQAERTLFRALIKVNGVGPKLALAVLSKMEVDAFVWAVRNGDWASLVQLPGIGKKTAERLIIEMRDRLQNWDAEQTNDSSLTSVVQKASDFVDEATSALVTLGYKLQEASRMITNVELNYNSSEELIRLALQGTHA